MFDGTLLITGGAGFLGRGILKRAAIEDWSTKIIVYSRDQQKHEAIKRRYPNSNVRCILGDILDSERLGLVMRSVDYVIHAAALKHLPECEAQPSQALLVNLTGTRSLMAAAIEAGVRRVVCISTDKAAGPMNTYGMTKALVERSIFETADFNSPTTFTGCRYGNVIGSTGSVWHAFKQQAAIDKYLKVTDPNMTRFFVTIDEAIDVVLASFTAPLGTIVIPEPRALNLGVLADWLTKTWCLSEYDVTGLRPGEKSHEVMLAGDELFRITKPGAFFNLHGPLVRPTSSPIATMVGASSETAVKMEPEEFYHAAMASDQI